MCIRDSPYTLLGLLGLEIVQKQIEAKSFRQGTISTLGSRLKDIIRISSGFLYQVNVSGVTGDKSANEIDVSNFVKRIQKTTKLPICSGFGIKSPEDAIKIANTGCQGVIVGSAFVKYIQDNIEDKNLPSNLGKYISTFTKELQRTG